MNSHSEMNKHLQNLKNGFLFENRSALLSEFRVFADLNKPLVVNSISKVNPQESEVFWNFIESLSDDINCWSDFIYNQFIRLLFAAEEMENPEPVINSLEAFNMLMHNQNKEFMLKIFGVIKIFINTESCHLKRFLVWLLTNYMHDVQLEMDLIRKLINDSDVIIRYYAKITYNSIKGYPPCKGIPTIDKLILSISDVYVCRGVSLKSIIRADKALHSLKSQIKKSSKLK
jgi:hypothetical protein